MICIYKYTNKINNKVYIGQTSNISIRKYQHEYHAFKLKTLYPIYNAFRKYGIDNFTLEILEECEKEFSNEKEMYYINLFDSTNGVKGYNLQDGGGRKSLHITTKEKLSLALKGNKNAIKANFSENSLKEKSERARLQLLGIPKSLETRNKISRTLKGKKRSVKSEIKRIKTLKFNKSVNDEEIIKVKNLLTNGLISVRELHKLTGINRPRIVKILKEIEGESGE